MKSEGSQPAWKVNSASKHRWDTNTGSPVAERRGKTGPLYKQELSWDFNKL